LTAQQQLMVEGKKAEKLIKAIQKAAQKEVRV
jgi:hypothetical protein